MSDSFWYIPCRAECVAETLSRTLYQLINPQKVRSRYESTNHYTHWVPTRGNLYWLALPKDDRVTIHEEAEPEILYNALAIFISYGVITPDQLLQLQERVFRLRGQEVNFYEVLSFITVWASSKKEYSEIEAIIIERD